MYLSNTVPPSPVIRANTLNSGGKNGPPLNPYNFHLDLCNRILAGALISNTEAFLAVGSDSET